VGGGSGVAIIAAGGGTDLYCHSEPPLTSGKLYFIINCIGGHKGGHNFYWEAAPPGSPLNRPWCYLCSSWAFCVYLYLHSDHVTVYKIWPLKALPIQLIIVKLKLKLNPQNRVSFTHKPNSMDLLAFLLLCRPILNSPLPSCISWFPNFLESSNSAQECTSSDNM